MDYQFDLKTAISLGELCQQTYLQYDSYKRGTSWNLPAPYALLSVLHAPYEKAAMPIGFVASKGSDLIVAWRGTDNLDEWVQDAKYKQTAADYLGSGIDVELGFNELYTTGGSNPSPQSASLDALRQHADGNLYITGHSLGAALAVLNALDIAINLKRPPIVYTLAGPRTGNLEFVFNFNQAVRNCWRVVNSNDLVPKLPPKSCPPIFHEYHYGHVSHEYRVTFGNRLDLPLDHSVNHYVATLKGLQQEG